MSAFTVQLPMSVCCISITPPLANCHRECSQQHITGRSSHSPSSQSGYQPHCFLWLFSESPCPSLPAVLSWDKNPYQNNATFCMGLPANASAEVLSPFTRVGLLRSNKSISSIKFLSHAFYFQNSTNAMHPASAKSPASKSLSGNPSDSPSLSHTSSSIRALASHGIFLQNAVPTHFSFQPWTCLGIYYPLFYSIYFSSVFWWPRPPSVLKPCLTFSYSQSLVNVLTKYTPIVFFL